AACGCTCQAGRDQPSGYPIFLVHFSFLSVNDSEAVELISSIGGTGHGTFPGRMKRFPLSRKIFGPWVWRKRRNAAAAGWQDVRKESEGIRRGQCHGGRRRGLVGGVRILFFMKTYPFELEVPLGKFRAHADAIVLPCSRGL